MWRSFFHTFVRCLLTGDCRIIGNLAPMSPSFYFNLPLHIRQVNHLFRVRDKMHLSFMQNRYFMLLLLYDFLLSMSD